VELFSISCTTCQKRLKVREASAIGEILICPSCGSMVLVEAPAEWRPDDTSAVSESATEAGLPASDESSLPEPPRPERVAPPPLTVPPTSAFAARSNDPDDPFQHPSPVTHGASEFETPEAEAEAGFETASLEEAAPPLLPDENWTSPTLRRRQQWLMVSVAAVVGVGMAVILLGVVASRNAASRPDRTQGEAGTATRDAANQNLGAPADRVDSAADETREVAERPLASADGGTASPEARSPADSSRDPDETSAAPPLVEAPEGAHPRENPSTEPTVKPDPEAGRGQEQATSEASSEPPAKQTPDTSALANTLEAFAPFIQDKPYVAPNTADAGDLKEPVLDPGDLEESDVSVPRPEPHEVNVAERLADRIPELDIPQMPLITFVRFLTGLSTIPISLDPDALALLRIKPDRPIAIKATNSDVGGILNAAIQPLGLAYVQVGDQLMITRPQPADVQLRIHRHSVEDLVGNDAEQLDELAEWITTMIEPDTWESQGGPGILRTEMPDLVIQHQDTVLFRALLFCERLRVARGLPTRTKLAPDLCRLEPRSSRAEGLLQKPLRIRFLEPTLLMHVLQSVTRETGLQILVDWQAIRQLGWTPEAETMVSAENVPVGEALSQMLRPMDLTYRVIDATTIQITSPEADENRWDVEFYPVARLLADSPDVTAVADRVRDAMQQAGIGETKGVVHFDPLSRHLVAALSQPDQRRLAVILQRWQTEAH